jgi:HSP20 family molecular chaperone IbpA
MRNATSYNMRTILKYNNVWDILDTFGNDFYNDFSYRHQASGHYNETENGYEYELELPGYKKKDVSISAVDGIITINAVRGEKARKLSVGVSEDADLSTISGQLADGLLSLKVDKQEKAKPITVKLK